MCCLRHKYGGSRTRSQLIWVLGCARQVMKMFMPMLAPAAGALRWRLPEGSVLAAGDLIATLDLTDPAAVTRAEPFTGAPPVSASCSPQLPCLAGRGSDQVL